MPRRTAGRAAIAWAQRWTTMIGQRAAVKRGRKVNRLSGDPADQLHERHDAGDFDTRTQDKLAVAGD